MVILCASSIATSSSSTAPRPQARVSRLLVRNPPNRVDSTQCMQSQPRACPPPLRDPVRLEMYVLCVRARASHAQDRPAPLQRLAVGVCASGRAGCVHANRRKCGRPGYTGVVSRVRGAALCDVYCACLGVLSPDRGPAGVFLSVAGGRCGSCSSLGQIACGADGPWMLT